MFDLGIIEVVWDTGSWLVTFRAGFPMITDTEEVIRRYPASCRWVRGECLCLT